MLIYVSASRDYYPTVAALAAADANNTYIFPDDVLSHLDGTRISEKDKREQRDDLICVCEKMVVAPHITAEMQEEISLAERLHLEVEYLA